jgi:hypothetical protein
MSEPLTIEEVRTLREWLATFGDVATVPIAKASLLRLLDYLDPPQINTSHGALDDLSSLGVFRR